ncbi:MAG: MBL fold metallo-hydrolase [Enterobacteriaceae bacterium]|nr:MBL fold metallo-hydrolase [Enterobacteriaceae bacterium]
MKLTFIGHQSWLVSHKNTNILVDPVLGSTMGNSRYIKFEMYPPRDVDINNMPLIDGIFISHEHVDHFDIDTLSTLPKGIPIYISLLMPSCIKIALEKLGHEVILHSFEEKIKIKDIKIIPFSAPYETILWESRVTQYLISDINDDECNGFIAVDAIISEEFIEKIGNEYKNPQWIIVANNSQCTPKTAQGAYTNLLPLESSRLSGKNYRGVKLLNSILIDYIKEIPEETNVIICGNGFINPRENYGPFLFSDNKALSESANQLSIKKNVYGPYPGEIIEITNNNVSIQDSEWIKLNKNKHQELKNKLNEYMDPNYNVKPSPFIPVLDEIHEVEENNGLDIIEKELTDIARALAIDPLIGRLAISMNSYLNGALNEYRVLIKFKDRNFGYAYSVSKCQFVKIDTDESYLSEYPFGIEIYIQDFIGLCLGKIQIWDLAGTSIRSWYLGGIYENMIVFFYKYFGEQRRPDLALKVYESYIEKINKA